MSSKNISRERLPYRARPVLEMLRDLARNLDADLDVAIVEVGSALESGEELSDADVQKILVVLMNAFKDNVNALNILNLLLESGYDAALLETDRISKKLKLINKKQLA